MTIGNEQRYFFISHSHQTVTWNLAIEVDGVVFKFNF